MESKNWIFITILVLSITSCSGYRMLSKKNPFTRYEISTICVPNFYNTSSLSNIAAVFHREIYTELTRYKDLKIKECDQNVDGVLIGVVDSNRSMAETIKTESVINSKFLNDPRLSSRKEFNITAISKVGLTVDFILIKHPKVFDRKLYELGELKDAPKSKILLKQSIPVDQNFNREIFTDDLSVVNNVQNRGSVKKKVIEMASFVRQSFKDLVLYAF